MSYYTSIRVVNKEGKNVKAEVSCGGKSRGFSNERTGEVSFDVSSKDNYTVFVKRGGRSTESSVRGGQSQTVRIDH